MSHRTLAEEYAQQFIIIYKDTLPDFDCGISSPEFGKCKLTKEDARIKAQFLYRQVISSQRNGTFDFSTGEMKVEDVLFRLGVVLVKNDHLKRRKYCPYNTDTIKDLTRSVITGKSISSII